MFYDYVVKIGMKIATYLSANVAHVLCMQNLFSRLEKTWLLLISLYRKWSRIFMPEIK